jgi:hypothetical protein
MKTDSFAISKVFPNKLMKINHVLFIRKAGREPGIKPAYSSEEVISDFYKLILHLKSSSFQKSKIIFVDH